MKRTPARRRKPAKTARPRIGRGWQAAGLILVGFVAFDANRDAILDRLPTLSTLTGLAAAPQAPAPSRSAAAPVAVAPARAPAASPPAAKPPEPRREAARSIPAAPIPAHSATTPVQTAPASARTAAAVPSARPPAGTAAPAMPFMGATSRAAPLRREPSATAPVWVTLEPGHTVRVTARQGQWQRVEAGIFVGWVEAGSIAAPQASAPAQAARQQAMPRHVSSAPTPADAPPVPRGAIAGLPR